MAELSISRRLGLLLAACGALMLASEEASAQSVECCPGHTVAVSALGVPCEMTIYALYDDGHREYFTIKGGSEESFPCADKMIGVFLLDCNGKPVEIVDGLFHVAVAPGCCVHAGVKIDGENNNCPHIYFFPSQGKCEC